jgi:hypothetical protein
VPAGVRRRVLPPFIGDRLQGAKNGEFLPNAPNIRDFVIRWSIGVVSIGGWRVEAQPCPSLLPVVKIPRFTSVNSNIIDHG